jgi:hypothetical protein
MSWSVSFAHAHKTQPKIVMQAKANEPRVSIERIFFKVSPLHAHTLSEVAAIFSNFRDLAPNPSPVYNY